MSPELKIILFKISEGPPLFPWSQTRHCKEASFTMWHASQNERMWTNSLCCSQMNHILNSKWPQTNAWRILLDKKIWLLLFGEQTWKTGMKIIRFWIYNVIHQILLRVIEMIYKGRHSGKSNSSAFGEAWGKNVTQK